MSIPFMQIRGGSSKGLYFLASDLPTSESLTNQIILDAVGRDDSQIDGLGGGHPLTSKVAIVSPSKLPNVDIDFLFIQVVVGQNQIDTTPNCGNILAGVGPFAIESGLVTPTDSMTKITVNMLNTNKLCELILHTPNGEINYNGDQRIDGVSGTSAPIVCNYMDISGSVTGELFPTGAVKDNVDGVEVTCIDNGMPVVLVRAEDLQVSGYETPEELNSDQNLKDKLESIRLAISPKMNIENAQSKAVPKMCIISPARYGGLINTRTFIPHHCHSAIGVLGAVSVATACIVKGSVAENYSNGVITPNDPISVEHPCGEFTVNLDFEDDGVIPQINGAGVIRTARLLSKGVLFVPQPN
ncbi:4-oxalomesaconate tautomerase [Colwellia sp. RE-S-Sl-9]